MAEYKNIIYKQMAFLEAFTEIEEIKLNKSL